MTSPKTNIAIDEGTMKNEIRCKPAFNRLRSLTAISSCVPSVPDIAGSSAAETDIPNRLTGNVYRLCAYVNAATACELISPASIASTNAEIWTTPRLTNTGIKFVNTFRTLTSTVSSTGPNDFSTFNTVGNWTAICNTLPTTEPHATITASRAWSSPPPKTMRVVMSARFHATGAVYDRKNRR